ncbi:MAG: ABC transporter permease [Acidobacteriaceae bacterium]
MVRDLKITVRQLFKSPAFALTAVLMLALGIGATTAIFSIVEGVLLRPLPFPHPNRLVVLSDVLRSANFGRNGEAGVTAPDVLAYTRYTHSFTALGGYGYFTFELSGDGQPVQLDGSRMTAGVLRALEVQPLLGRFFTQQEDEQKQLVVVLSYDLWQSRFHGDSAILGRKILIDRAPYTVIGVMPRHFAFPLYYGHANHAELWVPMSFTADDLGPGAASWGLGMVGRLKPGVTAAQAQQDAESVAQEIMRNYPPFMAGMHISAVVHPLQQDTVVSARPLLRTLFLAVCVVLLIACANLAGLLLVRAIRRRREIAVRLAIGAPAGALLRQAILESVVLSFSGGVLGLALAALVIRFGIAFLPNSLPLVADIAIDWRVALFALALGFLTGFVCGLAPAFAAIRTNVNVALREGGRTGTAGAGYARLRSVLVVAEIAVALILLCASGLLLRSFAKMRDVDVGFRTDHTLVAWYTLPQRQYSTQPLIDQFDRRLLDRLQALPGVIAVGVTDNLPGVGSGVSTAFDVADYVAPPGSGMPLAWTSSVFGDYLRAMGIPLLRGRLFNDADTAQSPLVAIVNSTLADRYWHGLDPIGRRIRWGTPTMGFPWMTVVGVVGDVRQARPDASTRPQIYQPAVPNVASFGSLAQPGDLDGYTGAIVLHTAVPPQQMESAFRATVRSIDPQLPLTDMETMESALSHTESPRRFNTSLISAFAAAALLLAILGIYSVIAFTVAQRTQEMAIRLALGSPRSAVRRLVLASAAKLALAGCIFGLAGAMAASKLLRAFLFGVSPFDPLVLTLAAVAVLLLSLLAALVPALHAASVNPILALRSE